MTDINNLIHGKDNTEKVVCIEPNGNELILFIENKDGISTKVVPNRHWILSDIQVDKNWIRLKGDLHYKWAKQFTDLRQYYFTRTLLRERWIDNYSIGCQKEANLIRSGITYFKGMNPTDVSILSFDIETNGLKLDNNSKLLLISNTFRKNGKIIRKLFSYDEYKNEGEMIKAWAFWICSCDPSIILGHNIYSFDFPFIAFIANKFKVKLKLGRDGSIVKFDKNESKFRKDATQFYHYKKARIYGREICDTLFLSISYDFSRKYESYGLKSIIKQENLEDKNRVFYDASKIRHNYMIPEEMVKIKQYAEFDADDALKLFDLMIPSKFYFTQHVPKSFTDIICSATGSQLNSLLVRSYLQEGHSIPKSDTIEPYEGAISFNIPGIFRNVMKIDFAALYPSIIREYQIYNIKKDPNGNFLKMVDYFTLERLKNKKLAKDTKNKYYYDLEQMGKIFINSAYGLLGCPGVNFNSGSDAAFITNKGRELLKKSILWATSKECDYWQKIFKERTKK